MKTEQPTEPRTPVLYAVRVKDKSSIALLNERGGWNLIIEMFDFPDNTFDEISEHQIHPEVFLKFKFAKNLDFFSPEFLKTETLEKISERLNYLTNNNAKQSILMRDLKDTNAELQKRISQSQNSNKLLRKELNSIQKKYFQLTKSNETTQHIK